MNKAPHRTEGVTITVNGEEFEAQMTDMALEAGHRRGEVEYSGSFTIGGEAAVKLIDLLQSDEEDDTRTVPPPHPNCRMEFDGPGDDYTADDDDDDVYDALRYGMRYSGCDPCKVEEFSTTVTVGETEDDEDADAEIETSGFK